MLTILIVANLFIGLSFVTVAAAAWWLYYHRRRDWPKSWVLVMVGTGMGCCGLARLVHAITYDHYPHVPLFYMVAFDSITAITAVFNAIFVPRAVNRISHFPTPGEIQAMGAKAETAKEMARQASMALQRKEVAKRQSRILLAIINHTPTLPDSLKQQVNEIISELNNGSDPDDNGGCHPHATIGPIDGRLG